MLTNLAAPEPSLSPDPAEAHTHALSPDAATPAAPTRAASPAPRAPLVHHSWLRLLLSPEEIPLSHQRLQWIPVTASSYRSVTRIEAPSPSVYDTYPLVISTDGTYPLATQRCHRRKIRLGQAGQRLHALQMQWLTRRHRSSIFLLHQVVFLLRQSSTTMSL